MLVTLFIAMRSFFLSTIFLLKQMLFILSHHISITAHEAQGAEIFRSSLSVSFLVPFFFSRHLPEDVPLPFPQWL